VTVTISYQVERLEHDQGEDLFLVKRYSGGVSHEDDEVLELEVVDDLMTLRATDVEAYEILVQVCAGYLERGAPMERTEA
jgi:hypothetical protein